MPFSGQKDSGGKAVWVGEHDEFSTEHVKFEMELSSGRAMGLELKGKI